MTRMKEIYLKDVVPQLMKGFGYKNRMQVPRLEKITLNMGLGEAVSNVKILDSAVEELTLIAGQKAVITKARHSIAAFKLREGMPIGVTVTLSKGRAYMVTLTKPQDKSALFWRFLRNHYRHG